MTRSGTREPCPYITDDHLHLDPMGRGSEAVKEFAQAGGTHLLLVHKPYHSVPGADWKTGKEWLTQADITLRLARKAISEGGLAREAVGVTLAPHPVELYRLMERLGPQAGEAAYRQGLEAAAQLASEGEACALGEVGRPHFPVPQAVMDAANATLVYALELARDAGVAAVLHTESATPQVMAQLAELAHKADFPLDRLVKHYSGPLTTPETNMGLVPSVIASRTNLKGALAGGGEFMMETDYLDDPQRPGAVMGPKTVPRRTLDAVAKGLMSPDKAWQVHVEVPARVYGLRYD